MVGLSDFGRISALFTTLNCAERRYKACFLEIAVTNGLKHDATHASIKYCLIMACSNYVNEAVY